MDFVVSLKDEQGENGSVANRRLRGFAVHLLVYFAAMLVLVPVNLFLYPETVWFVFPMVGWGSMLAIHVSFVMGLWGDSKHTR